MARRRVSEIEYPPREASFLSRSYWILVSRTCIRCPTTGFILVFENRWYRNGTA